MSGLVYGCGKNNEGQLGMGTRDQVDVCTIIE
jgi:alpha-tubulin suppressor-like RCC1 family protein